MTVDRGITTPRAGLGRFAYNGHISYGPIRRAMTSCATNGRAELGDARMTIFVSLVLECLGKLLRDDGDKSCDEFESHSLHNNERNYETIRQGFFVF